MDIFLARWRPARSMARHGVLLGALLALGACNKPKTDATGSEPSAEPVPPAEPVMLTINGFNYTDLYIDSFEVHGVGGGNIRVSSPGSGGGGNTCCLTWITGGSFPKELKIEWTRDGKRWCRGKAVLKGPEPARPEYLGIHFFPDGHIEAELTEHHAEPKLRLERFNERQRKATGNTIADDKVAECKNAPQFQ